MARVVASWVSSQEVRKGETEEEERNTLRMRPWAGRPAYERHAVKEGDDNSRCRLRRTMVHAIVVDEGAIGHRRDRAHTKQGCDHGDLDGCTSVSENRMIVVQVIRV